jgi:hypothetical protein
LQQFCDLLANNPPFATPEKGFGSFIGKDDRIALIDQQHRKGNGGEQ